MLDKTKFYPIEGHVNADDMYEQQWGGLTWNGMAVKFTSIHDKGTVDNTLNESYPDFEDGVITGVCVDLDNEVLLNIFNGHSDESTLDDFLSNETGFEVSSSLEMDS